MLSWIVGVMLIIGGLIWTLFVYMGAAVGSETGATPTWMVPMILAGLGAVVLGIVVIIYGR
jgi:hypothetical protein